MKISFNWLKQFIDIDATPEDVSAVLTSIGLEVESVDEYQTIKGGLDGVVVGKVLTRDKHPNADKLSVTTVDVGQGDPLRVVCGAPNVAAGQTVLVATIGTKLYSDGKEFTIQKSKIRGEESFGMICAEDELGLGTSHDGIMVLPSDVPAGTPARDYFGIESDFVFEIGLTPNRVDAASHMGVARDLVAYYGKTTRIALKKPELELMKNTFENTSDVKVTVENTELCPRYTGVVIEGVSVKESPQWLQNRLRAIGQKPINNVVDVTNYVLHELGQPLHAFDLAVVGKDVKVKTLPDKTMFTTLDGVERELSASDLMICNAAGGMCIAGVFGGAQSGVKETTTSIFLESAYFNPQSIRKTARRHQLSTDASFRFERGIDPNITLYALQRAASLVLEVAGGRITSSIFDTRPTDVAPFHVELAFAKVDSMIGKKIDHELIRKIIAGLEIKIAREQDETMFLEVPPFKVDVKRAEDVVEEILRIYGYNNVEIPTQVQFSVTMPDGSDDTRQRNTASDYLCSNGFCEIMCNSITKYDYYEKLAGFDASSVVKILNPLSSDLNAMRGSLLFGGLETVIHNINRQNDNLLLFEFGRTYSQVEGKQGFDKFVEKRMMSVIVHGKKNEKSWNLPEHEADYYFLKSQVESLLVRMGLSIASCTQQSCNNPFIQGVEYTLGNKTILSMGLVKKEHLRRFDISKPVYYADICWDEVLKLSGKRSVFKELPKFFEVRRDLSLLIDESVTFDQLKKIACDVDRKYIKEVTVFDVYQGKGIPQGKKSYAVSFVLQDEKETLKDSKIEDIMGRLIKMYKEKLGAELR